MRGSALRRALHAATAALALLPALVSWPAFRFTITSLFVVAAVVEAVRLRLPAVGLRLAAFVPVYRLTESNRLSGGFWLAAGYAIAAWLPASSPAPAIAGIAVAALADPGASLVGSTLARSSGKSWAGGAAALGIAAAALFVVGLPLRTVVAGAVVGAAVERWSAPLDDNLVLAPAVTLLVILLA